MKLTSTSLAHGQRIPERFAMGKPADPATFSDNVSPHLAWSGAPEGTRSFVLLCVDDDVPSRGDDVNQAGKVVPASLPRVPFYHWVLADIPASRSELPEGASANGVTQGGKACGPVDHGVQGANDYTSWFAGDETMGGDYGGYDGPFPPWNDERRHHYHFVLYALDIESLGLSGAFRGGDVLSAIEGHVLAQAAISCTYSIYGDAF